MGKDADCCDTCRELGHVTEVAPVTAAAPLSGGTVTLHVRSRGIDRTIVLGPGEHTLGRATTNAIPLDDHALSRRQCILRVTGDRVTVEDTQSACGTFLDGRHTRGPTEVSDGSTISMGSTRIVIVRVRVRD